VNATWLETHIAAIETRFVCYFRSWLKKCREKSIGFSVTDVSPEMVRLFLRHLKESRKCAVATRNQRLAAIHSLARFVGLHSPEHIEWCGQLRAIPPKRAPRATITYLEKPEMDALLKAPDQSTEQGRRDHALLLFLYNTGARADEAAQVKIVDLLLTNSSRHHSFVQLRGKGNKSRRCPPWPQTVVELSSLTASRPPTGPVFLNRCGQSITRFGIHAMVERYIENMFQGGAQWRTSACRWQSMLGRIQVRNRSCGFAI